jgi:hypothetical protein
VTRWPPRVSSTTSLTLFASSVIRLKSSVLLWAKAVIVRRFINSEKNKNLYVFKNCHLSVLFSLPLSSLKVLKPLLNAPLNWPSVKPDDKIILIKKLLTI